jgi:hypothetical protein
MKTAQTTLSDARRDAVATAALIVIRRALVEGVPVTWQRLVAAASIELGASAEHASHQVHAVAQGLGVSPLE